MFFFLSTIPVKADAIVQIRTDEREIGNAFTTKNADKVVLTEHITNAGYGDCTIEIKNINRPIIID